MQSRWNGLLVTNQTILMVGYFVLNRNSSVTCQVCGKTFQASSAFPAKFIRPAIIELLTAQIPGWKQDGYICQGDLNHYRSTYVRNVLETERGELTSLEHDVLQSLKEQELLTRNLNTIVKGDMTFGQRLADRVAAFGGSWPFILLFVAIIFIWIAINSRAMAASTFDPYPFILLNLVLSCVAALQAPVIMMSQNRQQTKDRLTAENDYRINLKAELEIRHLHSKLDLLLTHQWQRLMDIQQVQTDLLEELGKKK